MTPICLNSPKVFLITPNRNLNSPKVIFVTLGVFCFYAERQNVPPFLPFLLGMPLYKGVEAREGFLSSLPSPSRFSDLCLPSIKRGTQKGRVTGGIFRFPPVCEPQ